MCPLVNESASSFHFQSLQIELTNRCNLHCSTCLHSIPEIDLFTQDLSFAALSKVESILKNTDSVHLQGWGEILLLENLVKYIQWFKAHGCRVSLTTNGTLMTPARAETLITSGLDAVTFSMAGVQEKTHDTLRGHGTHAQLWQGMRNMYTARKRWGKDAPAVAVSYLLTPETFQELPQAIHRSRSCGISLFACIHQTHPVTKEQKAMCLWNTHADNQKKIVRRAFWQAFLARIRLQLPSFTASLLPICDKNPVERCFIAADGSVAPCVFLYPPHDKRAEKRGGGAESTNLPRKRFGSLTGEIMAEIWQKQAYREFREVFLKRKFVYDRAMVKVGTDLDGIDQLERAREQIKNAFRTLPVPKWCSSCPKMKGL